MKAIWGLVGVGLLAAPMRASAADLATSIDGGINAGVTTSLHSAETVDVHSDGFIGAPTSLQQSAHALSGSLSSQYVEGHANISAAWESADRGTIEFQLDGAIQATCCGNSVYTSPTFLDDWHYTFVPSSDGVFRLGYRLTGSGIGTCGFRVYINGAFVTGFETPDDGTTLTNSQDFPLIAGQTYTFALDNCAGFSTTAETLTSFVASGSFTFEILVPEPDEQLADLIQDVIDLGIKAGPSSAFQSKLKNALEALERGDTSTALALLHSFINSVEAQRGKALTDAQADALIAAAQAIIDSLSQP